MAISESGTGGEKRYARRTVNYESVWLRQPEPARAGDFVCVCVHSNCTDCKSTLQWKEQNKQIYVVYLELALAV